MKKRKWKNIGDDILQWEVEEFESNELDNYVAIMAYLECFSYFPAFCSK